MDGEVIDQIQVLYSPIVLPYHIHSWEVAQLVPYFNDLCVIDESNCGLTNEYKDYCLENYSSVLSMDISRDDFVVAWAQEIGQEFGISSYALEELYGPNDDHSTWNRTRMMWKYSTSKGVNWTPSVFINGVKLDKNPNSVDSWINHLQQVYDSQYSHNNPLPYEWLE